MKIKTYCTYAYLRTDGTPYYIGKGCNYRPFSKNHYVNVPPRERILILKKGLTNEQAIKHEIYMISVFGRKDIGTGILRNLTNGGEGNNGWKMKSETRTKISEAHSGKTLSGETRQLISENIKGYNWYHNGKISIQSREHPGVGWEKGRLPSWKTSDTNKGMNWYHKNGEVKMFSTHPGDGWEKGRPRQKGKKYYNNGSQHILAFEPPSDEWVPGRLRKSYGSAE